MVYSERKNRGEAKCAVYGLSTDCERFAFYHVDDYGYVWLYLCYRQLKYLTLPSGPILI